MAPVVYGGKLRAVMAYLDRDKLQARDLSPVDVMKALDNYNLFLPTGDAKFGDTDYAIDSNSMYDLVERMGDIPLRTEHGNADYLARRGHAQGRQLHPDEHRSRQRPAQVYIPVFRQLGSSTLSVVEQLKTSRAGHDRRG